VNLIYGAFYYFEDPRQLVDSLTDNIAAGRIEIDSVDFRGPYFDDIENSVLNLHLIRSGKTRAVMIKPDGNVIVPAEMLYKKNVLTIRGTFKPVTCLNVDMIEQGFKSFRQLPGVTEDNSIVLAEISLNDSHGHDMKFPEEDLVVRVQLLNSLGYSVMVSDYTRYFSLRAYFRQYTNKQIGIVLGMVNMREIFDEARYSGVEGGILEGFGKLFPDNTRLFVYPEMLQSGELSDLTTLQIDENLQFLYRHLLQNNFITSIETSDREFLNIYSREVLTKIPDGGDWQKSVPPLIADTIEEERLFGFRKAA